MLLFNTVICDYDVGTLLDECNVDCHGGSLKRSLADQISAGGDIRVHCMASDWSSVRNATDEHNAVE